MFVGTCSRGTKWREARYYVLGGCVRERAERGRAHLSPHFMKLGSLRSKGLALADNLSLERDNLRLPLVQLGLRLIAT